MFVVYPKTLPNKNVAYDKIMAEYINKLPDDVEVRLSSCCWGEWGQPEPKAIYYQLDKKDIHQRVLVTQDRELVRSCEEVKSHRPLLILGNPNDAELFKKWKDCFGVQTKIHTTSGRKIFSSLYLP